MRKNIFSCVLAIVMILGILYVPVSAHQNINISTDFSNYVGTWNGSTMGNAPTCPGGDFATYNYKAYSANYGITSGVPEDSKYGTALKVYQAEETGSSVYGGAKYEFSTKPSHSVYMGVSINVESTENNTYIARSIRFHSTNGGKILIPIYFNGSNLELFRNVMKNPDGTNYTYLKDKWYDFKLWANMDTGAYKVEVWLDNVKIGEMSGVDTGLEAFDGINRVEFFHPVTSGAFASKGIKDPQITYFDNFEVKSIYKFEIDEKESASMVKFDFNDYTNTDTLKVYPTSTYGNWYAGYSGAGYHGLFAEESDRGTSLRIDVPKITKNADGTYTMEGTDRVLDRTYSLYTGGQFDLKTAYGIKDAIYFKTSVLFKDKNFGNFKIQFNNSGHSPISTKPDGSINTFNGIDTGLDFATNVWYDVECTVDVNTGYYTCSVSDGKTTYNGSGFSTAAKGATITRIGILFYNSDYTLASASAMLVDDMQFGSIPKFSVPVSRSYDFSDGTVPSAFTTTGGTAAVVDNALVLTGVEGADTVSAMSMPFANSAFGYSGDITLSDMAADRVLSAAGFELLTFGADGSLKIGGTVVDGVTVDEDTYNVNLILNQPLHIGEVTVSNAEGQVANASVNLGTSALNAKNISWTVKAGESKTVIDNVSVNTVFDFAINEDLSTTGETKHVEALDDVVISFTNPVAKETFTKDNISVNFGKVYIEKIEFVDEFTVKVNFEKEQGTHYHVQFTNVSDVYGNSLTDYVEFDTARQDLVMSAIGFSRGNEALSLSTPGTVTASFDAKANNGNTYDMTFILGLYEGGRMVTSAIDTFTVGEAKETHPLNITVPNDNKYYVVKAFLLDAATLAPIVETAVLKPVPDVPVVIVKLDDLTHSTRLTTFEGVADWARENQIKMGFGLIGASLDNANDTDIQRIKALAEDPMIEMWYHAYDASAQLGSWSNEKQKEDFEKGMTAAEREGFEFVSFNAPSNNINAYTGDLLDEYGFKVVMSMWSEAELNKIGFFDHDFTTLYKKITVEMAATTANGNVTVVRPFAELKADWETAKANGYEYVLLQSHPCHGWGIVTDVNGVTYGNEGNRLYDFLLWLKNSEGAVFMTPSEYAAYAATID